MKLKIIAPGRPLGPLLHPRPQSSVFEPTLSLQFADVHMDDTLVQPHMK